MGTRAPKVGDNIEILRDGAGGASEVSEGDIYEIVGLSGSGSGIVISVGGQAVILPRSLEGRSWENLTVTESVANPLGVQGMKKKLFVVAVLEHKPVPGIPETVADIETTIVFGPQEVLAVDAKGAEIIAHRKLDEKVNIEYTETLVRDF